MSADEVLEAMARGMWEATDRHCSYEMIPEILKRLYRKQARAAVRAAQEVGAILVAEMPEDDGGFPMSDRDEGWQLGHNAALAAVRAKAVTVEGV